MSIMSRLRQSLRSVRERFFVEELIEENFNEEQLKNGVKDILATQISKMEAIGSEDIIYVYDTAAKLFWGDNIYAKRASRCLELLDDCTYMNGTDILSKVKEKANIVLDSAASRVDLLKALCDLTDEQALSLEGIETKFIELGRERRKELLRNSIRLMEKDDKKYYDEMVLVKNEIFSKGYYSEKDFNKIKDRKSKLFDEELKVLRSYVSQYGDAISFEMDDWNYSITELPTLIDSNAYMTSIFGAFNVLTKLGLKNEQLLDLIELNKDFLIEESAFSSMIFRIENKAKEKETMLWGLGKKEADKIQEFLSIVKQTLPNSDCSVIAHCLNIEECQAKAFLDAYGNDRAYRGDLQQQSQNEIKEAVEEMMQENLVAKQAKLIAEKMGARDRN